MTKLTKNLTLPVSEQFNFCLIDANSKLASNLSEVANISSEYFELDEIPIYEKRINQSNEENQAVEKILTDSTHCSSRTRSW